MQSRYYNPEWGRFINADAYISTGTGLLGHNMFAYCLNNPVVHKDTSGAAVETVFDILSLGVSLFDVAINPADPWAWIGLVGDAADVAIPFVGGMGEAIDILRAANIIDDTVDAVKITKNTLELISATSKALSIGNNAVYVAYQADAAGILEYVGITNCFDRRRGEWLGKRAIHQVFDGVDRDTARYAEQTVISLFGRGGTNQLSNIRNSIGKNGRLYDGYEQFFRLLMK